MLIIIASLVLSQGQSEGELQKPIGPEPPTQVYHYTVDRNAGGGWHTSTPYGDHRHKGGLAAVGEFWVERQQDGVLRVRGYQGEPRLHWNCEGLIELITGKVATSRVTLELKRNKERLLERLYEDAGYWLPFHGKHPPDDPNYQDRPVHAFQMPEERLHQASTITAFTRGENLEWIVETNPRARAGAMLSLPMRKNYKLSETGKIYASTTEAFLSDPAQLKAIVKEARKENGLELTFLNAQGHMLTHLLPRGWQIVTYKSWSRTLSRFDLMEGSKAKKLKYCLCSMWVDEKDRFVLSTGGVGVDQPIISAFITPYSSNDSNGRPWPWFFPPKGFVPPPEINDGG